MCVQDVNLQILGSRISKNLVTKEKWRDSCQKESFPRKVTWCCYLWLRPILSWLNSHWKTLQKTYKTSKFPFLVSPIPKWASPLNSHRKMGPGHACLIPEVSPPLHNDYHSWIHVEKWCRKHIKQANFLFWLVQFQNGHHHWIRIKKRVPDMYNKSYTD